MRTSRGPKEEGEEDSTHLNHEDGTSAGVCGQKYSPASSKSPSAGHAVHPTNARVQGEGDEVQIIFADIWIPAQTWKFGGKNTGI